ncbi:MAG: PqqD family protein [Planctomycetota bacterium]
MSKAGVVAPDADSWKRMLDARAVRNTAARADQGEPDAVVVHVKTVRPWYMVPPVSWIVPHRPERRVELDRLGSQVWRLCDGERTVETVVDSFAADHELTFHEARVAVAGYISSLVKRGVLAIVMPEEDAA